MVDCKVTKTRETVTEREIDRRIDLRRLLCVM